MAVAVTLNSVPLFPCTRSASVPSLAREESVMAVKSQMLVMMGEKQGGSVPVVGKVHVRSAEVSALHLKIAAGKDEAQR